MGVTKLVIMENYPQLKSNETVQALMVNLEGTENRISVARRRYIESVQQFNNLVTVFPTSLTNSLIHKFDKKPQFTATETEQATPQVQF